MRTSFQVASLSIAVLFAAMGVLPSPSGLQAADAASGGGLTLDRGGLGSIELTPNNSTATTPAPSREKEDKEGGKRKESSGNGTTEITADEGSFDQKERVAVFIKNVTVKNPQFNITCDKLTAYLHRDPPKTAEAIKGATPGRGTAGTHAKPVPAATPVPIGSTGGNPIGTQRGSAADSTQKGGLEKAIAEGNVEIIQDKTDSDGNVERDIGHAKKAVYDAVTGDITLTGKPDVQQGLNLCIALSEDTVMILNRAGSMKVKGPHKTVIKDSSPSPSTPR